jgi:hypothetical protein
VKANFKFKPIRKLIKKRKKKRKKQEEEKKENLGNVDNKLPEFGVPASLLLKPIGNGFADGFESEGSQLCDW